MSDKGIGFKFPLDTAQQWDGFNDAGIEHFSGNPFEYLGREVTQNTLDAMKTAPAKLVFTYLEVETSSIPDVQALRRAINACADGATEEGVKAEAFFQEAVSLLKKKKVGVLQISDYSTTGVIGPCENGRPYFALMKASGQSKKSSGTAAGSFGIGKFAPYTASGLRTLFVTTVFQDDESQWHHYCQGKSILMSHIIGSKTFHGTGYWGNKESCHPVVDDQSHLPNWLRRGTVGSLDQASAGTTLNILGFAPRKGWQQLVAANVAENFFGAIIRNHLEVEIVGGPTINAHTLGTVFSDKQVRDALADQKGEPEKIDSRLAYLRALTSGEKRNEHTQNEKLGNCELHILVGEGLPKRVAFLRNGMLITDELSGLKRFGDFKEFAAVLECHSDKGNALLRMMEPPRHDDFEPERLPTEKEKRAAKIALKEITAWVRDMLARHAKDPVSEVTALDELAEFFGDNDGEDGKKSLEEDPQGKLNIRARPLPRPKSRTSAPTEIETGEDDFGQTGDDESPTEPGVRDDADGGGGATTNSKAEPQEKGSAGVKGGSNTPAYVLAELGNVRAIPAGAKRRRIAFTAFATCSLDIELQDSGADTNRLLTVTASSEGIVKDGRITGVPVKASARTVIDVEFDADFGGTLRILAHAV